MVSFKELGLVNTREMFAKAIDGGYAIPAFNFNNMEQLQAIIKAAAETKSPVILQVSSGARKYANQTLLRYMAQGAVEYAKELGWEHPQIALHLDHGNSFELCKSCVDFGFSSVMIDGSSLPYEENIALTRQVVEYAHQFDVTVEAELGVLAGVEDEVEAAESHYTKPEEVIDFATRTGCDSLAISIGTSHGAYKFTPEQCTIDPETGRLVPPSLAFPRSMSTSSTPTAASCLTLWVFPRSSCARPLRAQCARSTSTAIAVWPSLLLCARCLPRNPESSTRVSIAVPLAMRWNASTSTKSSRCWEATARPSKTSLSDVKRRIGWSLRWLPNFVFNRGGWESQKNSANTLSRMAVIHSGKIQKKTMMR